jgi:tetratricopeptide (TPR) repeat protein
MSRESFEQAYYEIAKCLSLQGLHDAQVDIKRLVRARLSEEGFGPWLIIVDNADNTSVLLDDTKADRLIDYLPQSSKGSVIFTTRTRAAANQLAENNIIALEELQRAEAVEMLDRRLSHENRHQLKDSGTVDNFLDMLYCHALAIVQAVAFINTNGITLFDYIELYRSSEMDAIDLLREEFDDRTRYQEATNSVATTWYISFEQIQKSNAIAAEHLFFVACTAANDIPASMYPPDYTKTEHLKAMGTLKAYGFITERPQQPQNVLGSAQKHVKIYDTHPLVHLAIRGWLKAHHQWILWLDTTLVRLIKITPYGNYDTREYWITYLHHAVYLASQPEVHEMEGRMTLLERVGGCERELGRFQAAEQTYRKAFEQRKKVLGEHHPNTLMTRGNVGLVMGLQGRWTEAEKINREVFTQMKEVLGEKHPDTLTSNGNLALSVLGQGRYTEAEKMYREYLPLTREVRGEKDPGTITAMHNLGAALRSQGKYVDAEKILRDTLQVSTEVLGAEDANTLSTLGVLGSMLLHQRKYVEAETTNRSTLVLRQKVLGDSHPDTLTSMLSVGIALRGQSKLAEAAQIQIEALALSEKVSGKESPHTLAHRGAWAQTLRAQGKYDEAEQIHRETLAVKEKVLGKMNLDTLMSVYWLAGLAHDQVQYEDALPLYQRAYTGFVSALGGEHPTTRECEDHFRWIGRMVEEDRVREEEKAMREEEDRLEWEAREEELKPTSTLTLIDTRIENMGEAGEKRRGRWRTRLKDLVKKAG